MDRVLRTGSAARAAAWSRPRTDLAADGFVELDTLPTKIDQSYYPHGSGAKAMHSSFLFSLRIVKLLWMALFWGWLDSYASFSLHLLP